MSAMDTKKDKNHFKEKEQELISTIEEYEKQRDDLKKILGEIGGKSYSKRDTIVNILFLGCILTLFILEITTHLLPVFVSLEVSILLVSIKIVWMFHSMQKVYHFQFWVLNSIEYRVNELTEKVRNIDKNINKKG